MIKKPILGLLFIIAALAFPVKEGFALTSTDSFYVNVSITGCTANGVCEPALGETALNCTDCACNNNGVCDGAETFATCPNDCHCGNTFCDYGETLNTCPSDCKADPPTPTPFAISNVAASNITQTSAVITWLTNRPGICATNIGVTMDYASSSMVEIGYSLEHMTEIAGLTPSTLYHYSITCYATSTYSPANSGDYAFTTLSGEMQPQLNVSDLYAVPDETYINLYWHNPTNVEFAGVEIRRSLIDYPQLGQGELVYTGTGNALVGGEVTFQDTGLSRGTMYYYTVFAFNTSGQYASGAGVHARTLGVSPLGDISGLRAVPDYYSIALYWQNPSSASFAGVLIKRSTAGYPGLSSGTTVYDGLGNAAAAPEVTFNDTGLTTSTLYYYTLFAYNQARQYSSGVGIQAMTLAETIIHITTTPPTTTPETTTPPHGATTTPPGIVENLIFPDFDVTHGGLTASGRSDGAVLLLPNESVVISLRGSRALSKTAKMVLSVVIDGREAVYLFSFDSISNTYSVSIPGIAAIGSYPFAISVYDSSNALLKELFGRFVIAEAETLFPLAPPIVQEIAQTAVKTYNAISQIAQSDAGKSVASAMAGIAVVNAALAFPWWSWLNMLQFLFTQPFVLLFGRRKRWGVVYNSITKKPVDLALVRLRDAMTDRLIASKVTDSQGRYLFLVDAGEYKLTVEKPGYSFPSTLLNHIKTDGDYADVYYGDNITVGILGKSAIIANIAVDQDDLKISDKEVLRNISRDHLKRIIGALGPIFALLYFIFFPSWFSGVLVALHLLMTLVFHRFTVKKISSYWGHVYDKADHRPIRQAITRIFSAEYGRMLEYYVTDSQGRYGFLVGANRYYVTGDKKGYETARTKEINLIGKPGEQIIAEDLSLRKIKNEKNGSQAVMADEEEKIEPIIENPVPEIVSVQPADSEAAAAEKEKSDDLAAVMDALGTDKKMPAMPPSETAGGAPSAEAYEKKSE